MAIYRIFPGNDGESHIEEMSLDDHPELGGLTNLSEVRVQQFDGTRKRDFNPLPERRLIIHLSGEVEIQQPMARSRYFEQAIFGLWKT